MQLVFETGKPIAQVARDLGVNEGTLGNWCAVERRRREGGQAGLSEDERAELVRLRKEIAELRMQRVCSSSAFFRLSSRICAAASEDTPGASPASTAACRIHLRNVSV